MVTGFASKLQSKLTESGAVEYGLPLGDERLPLNPQLGKTIELHFAGHIACVGCGRKVKKSYQQGYCFPCTQSLAQCDICIVKPELCHFDKGTCREPDWGRQHCMQPHYVYLANTSELKVGITRASQLPTRWIDQGATQALPILLVKSRYLAGVVEVAITTHVKDKTNWRKMLQASANDIDLLAHRDETIQQIADWLHELKQSLPADSLLTLPEAKVQAIQYPVLSYPAKVNSLSLVEGEALRGRLLGIKGQYLILEQGVLNVRNLSGYELSCQFVG